MKLKGIELNGTYKIIYYDTSFAVYDEKGNQIYLEDGNGYWSKKEYNEKGNQTYYENSYGYWSKREYDKKGNMIYFKDSDGEIIDERVEELTIEEIEKILGYKIKLKENRK